MNIDVNAPEFKAAVETEVAKLVQEKVEAETKGLKAKNDELLGEIKGFKQKFDGVDPDEFKKLKGAQRDADDKNSDPVKMRERIEQELAPKLTEAEKRATTAESKLDSYIKDNQLTAALVEAGVAKEFLPAAKALLQASRTVEVKDGGAIIDGKSIAEFVKAWAGGEGKAFISAPNNNGGGGKGGAGGGAAGKKASEMTRTEKAKFMKENGLDAWKEKVDNES